MDERSHSLIYYKSENTSEKAQGSIDLLLIADIVPYDKNKDSDRASTTAPTSTDLARFNIDMGETILNLMHDFETDRKSWTKILK